MTVNYRKQAIRIVSGIIILITLIGCGFIQSLGALDVGTSKRFNAYGETDYQAVVAVQAGSNYDLILTSVTQKRFTAGININICTTQSDLICDNPVAKYHDPSTNQQEQVTVTFIAPSQGQVNIHVEWIADKSDKLGEYELIVQPHTSLSINPI